MFFLRSFPLIAHQFQPFTAFEAGHVKGGADHPVETHGEIYSVDAEGQGYAQKIGTQHPYHPHGGGAYYKAVLCVSRTSEALGSVERGGEKGHEHAVYHHETPCDEHDLAVAAEYVCHGIGEGHADKPHIEGPCEGLALEIGEGFVYGVLSACARPLTYEGHYEDIGRHKGQLAYLTQGVGHIVAGDCGGAHGRDKDLDYEPAAVEHEIFQSHGDSHRKTEPYKLKIRLEMKNIGEGKVI